MEVCEEERLLVEERRLRTEKCLIALHHFPAHQIQLVHIVKDKQDNHNVEEGTK